METMFIWLWGTASAISNDARYNYLKQVPHWKFAQQTIWASFKAMNQQTVRAGYDKSLL